MSPEDRAFLGHLFHKAVAAADPARVLPPFLPRPPKGRTVVVGAGKGVAELARVFDTLWDAPLSGVVVTRHGQATSAGRIRVLEAAHPVPDAAGVAAVAEIRAALEGLTPDDLVVALITGGGSSLLPAPGPGMSLEDEIALNETLLNSGAPIAVMNAIRKQVSRVKGGRLALAAHPARVVSLVVSDVPGDDPAQVASGPTVPDRVTRADARALATTAWRINLPPAVERALAGDDNPAPLPDDPRLARNETHVIASARLSLEAAASESEAHGIPAHILSDAIEGEARDVGRVHAAISRETALRGRPFARPALILSGGETTVTLRGKGRGGRNTEFLLAFALATEGLSLAALAADTDGIDGSEANAGAFSDGTTATRLRELGQDPQALLSANDAWSAFAALDDLFITGPTGTNVNDFRAILIR